jgi:hypothetical protein
MQVSAGSSLEKLNSKEKQCRGRVAGRRRPLLWGIGSPSIRVWRQKLLMSAQGTKFYQTIAQFPHTRFNRVPLDGWTSGTSGIPL